MNQNPPIFRWSVWGDNRLILEMLSHSVGTFRQFFGEDARYVIFTDEPDSIARSLKVKAEVRDVADSLAAFSDHRCTWRKWWPRARLDPLATEVRVDADIFLLDEPSELRKFCYEEGASRVLCTVERYPQRYYGNFESRVGADVPALNTGLVAQRPGADIERELLAEYAWWSATVPEELVHFHDEQGAVAKVIEGYLRREETLFLPPERYRIVCPLDDPPVTSLDGMVMLHSTFQARPAYRRFRAEISSVSGVPLDAV